MRMILLALVFFSALLPGGIPQQEKNLPMRFDALPAEQISISCDIASIIAKAHTELRTVKSLQTGMALYREELAWPGKKPKPLAWYPDFAVREIPLILLDPYTCMTTRSSVLRYKGSGTVPLFASMDARFSFDLEPRAFGTVWNWWNTAITTREGWIVVGAAWQRFGINDLVVYTPYSSPLLAAYPVLAAQGQAHIEGDVVAALEELRSERIMSRSRPGLLVADVIEKHLQEALGMIPLIEQSDPDEVLFFKNGLFPLNPWLRVLTIVGANGNRAYNATVSTAGARGLMQVMPSTCGRLKHAYPEASLGATCTEGGDHRHIAEMKTAAVLLDDQLATFKRSLGNEIFERPDLMAMSLAAYNTGPGRVVQAIRGSKSWQKQMKSEPAGYLTKMNIWQNEEVRAAR